MATRRIFENASALPSAASSSSANSHIREMIPSLHRFAVAQIDHHSQRLSAQQAECSSSDSVAVNGSSSKRSTSRVETGSSSPRQRFQLAQARRHSEKSTSAGFASSIRTVQSSCRRLVNAGDRSTSGRGASLAKYGNSRTVTLFKTPPTG